MDNVNADYTEESSSGQAPHRQQAREFRRRLLRSSRTTATAHEDHVHRTPVSTTEDDNWSYSRLHQRVPRLRVAALDAIEAQEEAAARIEPSDAIQRLSGSDDRDIDVEADVDVEPDHPEGGDVEMGPEVSEVDEVEDAEEEEEMPFDASAIGLKEISNLASFIVSSYKPGCGVKELRDDDVNQYWQSDGPQPHRLNIHFIKRVEIRALRLYLDYELDESYTPTKIQITAGTGPNLTIPFTTMELSMPKGWVDVPIAGAGGGPDGNSLCCWFLRVIILENHQNGKDTHIRGVKVYALDEGADTADNNPIDDAVNALDDYQTRVARMSIGDGDEDALMRLEAQARKRKANAKKYTPGDGGLSIPDFMREPEIR